MSTSNDDLIERAERRAAEATTVLQAAAISGRTEPVPAAVFTRALVSLREASAAVTELERRARGGAPVKEG